MPTGIIVNVLVVALGGIIGTIIGQKMPLKFTAELNLVLGLCSIGMGISSVTQMENMPAVILAVVFGTAIGLLCHLGLWIHKGAEQMQKPVSRLLNHQHGDLTYEEFMSMLVTIIVLFCTSGTGIYGSLDLGMTGDSTILLSKSILDLFTAMVFACNLGAVVSMVAVPQFIIFMLLFFAARLIYPLTTPEMLADFKACGGFLLIATRFRITRMQNFPIADMLPAMVFVMPFSFLWTNYISPFIM